MSVSHFDKWGLPGTIQDDGSIDGGDTCAIVSTLASCNSTFIQELLLFVTAGEEPVRHPDTTRWYGRPGRFSRDQLIPLLCAIAVNKDYTQLVSAKLYTMHKKRRFLTTWNTIKNGVEADASNKSPDFCGPEVWALWNRALGREPWYLGIQDLELVLSAVHWRFFRKDRVSRNHLLSVFVCSTISPTISARFARWLTPVEDLINRWDQHCEAVREYNTAPHLRRVYGKG